MQFKRSGRRIAEPCAVAIASRGFAEHLEPIANVGVGYNSSPESQAALAVAQEHPA